MLLLIASLTGAAGAATSVSQYGITWTFSQDRPVGQFANGDWWVVGPVTIVDINPKTIADPALDIHFIGNGSMLNPIPGVSQGLHRDGQAGGGNDTPVYTPSKNISLALPYTVAGGNSVYSTIRNPDTWASGADGEKTWFKETAVLTVVSAAPQAGSFRPPYAGTDKTIRANWNVSNINYSVLRNLAIPVPSNAPSLDWLERATQRPLLEMHYNWPNSNWKAAWAEIKSGGYPRRTYGREIGHISGAAGLMLNTNLSNAAKQKLAIQMIQWGIDISGLLKAGMRWEPNGGHQHGRLMPIYLAAKLLGDTEMLGQASGRSPFAEMSNHTFITLDDVNTPRAPHSPPFRPYTSDMIGMPEWSSSGMSPYCSSEWGSGDINGWWGVPYRTLAGAPNCSTVAAILLMGGRAEVGQEAYFKYHIDRYYPRERPTGNFAFSGDGNGIQAFTRDMWDTYVSGSVPPPVNPTPPAGMFSVGNRIQVWRATSVYGTASTVSQAGSQQAPNLGTILEGPVGPDSQNVMWYRLNYDNGPDGWSSEDNFLLSQSPPASTFAVGDRVKVWRQTWVNNTAATTSPLGQQPAETLGVITEGPVSNGVDNIFWFKITYDSGPSGWSGADNLIKTANTSSPSQPVAPTGLRVVE